MPSGDFSNQMILNQPPGSRSVMSDFAGVDYTRVPMSGFEGLFDDLVAKATQTINQTFVQARDQAVAQVQTVASQGLQQIASQVVADPRVQEAAKQTATQAAIQKTAEQIHAVVQQAPKFWEDNKKVILIAGAGLIGLFILMRMRK